MGERVASFAKTKQLPPIHPNSDNKVLDHPHIFLDEVLRQNKESEIIRLATAIREGKSLSPYIGKEVKIVRERDLDPETFYWADQVLVGTNNKRVALNEVIRKELEFPPEPSEGDKLICLKNYWDTRSDFDTPLTNGEIVFIDRLEEIRTKRYGRFEVPYMEADLITQDDCEFKNIKLDAHCLVTGETALTPQEIYKIKDQKNFLPLAFTYGYAITYWKSQGSEWNNILIFEENFPYDKTTHRQAMYTAVTRAKNKLVLVTKD